MRIIKSKKFKGRRAWEATDIANMNGITTRLHWTDAPYKWHINDGEEIFAVMDGSVDMHYRKDGQEYVETLETGDIFYRRNRNGTCSAPEWGGPYFGHREGGKCLKI